MNTKYIEFRLDLRLSPPKESGASRVAPHHNHITTLSWGVKHTCKRFSLLASIYAGITSTKMEQHRHACSCPCSSPMTAESSVVRSYSVPTFSYPLAPSFIIVGDWRSDNRLPIWTYGLTCQRIRTVKYCDGSEAALPPTHTFIIND